jgi:hypothetical protein
MRVLKAILIYRECNIKLKTEQQEIRKSKRGELPLDMAAKSRKKSREADSIFGHVVWQSLKSGGEEPKAEGIKENKMLIRFAAI